MQTLMFTLTKVVFISNAIYTVLLPYGMVVHIYILVLFQRVEKNERNSFLIFTKLKTFSKLIDYQ